MQTPPNELETLPINLSEYTDEEIEQAFLCYPSLWAQTLVNESGIPIEFDDHNFMWDIYNDFSPYCVVLKPPQVGMTTAQILKCLFVAWKENKQIVYTLPTDDAMYEMVSGTFNRLIAQNKSLQEWVSDSDTMSHKQVGTGMIRFRGTSSAIQAMSYPSDINVHDELDASNFENIQLMETRQQAKAEHSTWYFSHPSLAGFGVDLYWQRSDKREWVVTCGCGKQQILTWPDSISSERACYQCKYCKEPISNEQRRKGKWLPTAEGKYRGYHISQLMCPWITAQKILDDKADRSKNEQYFYNYVLGLPYVGSESKIPSSIVLKNVRDEVNRQEDRIIIGVDPGMPIYYTCLNKQGAFYYGACSDKDELGKPQDPWDDIRKLMKRWPTSIVMVDGNGDATMQRRLQAEYPGRVYLVFYRKDRKSKEMFTWGENDELGTVRVDRNMYFQWMVEQLRDVGRIPLNGKEDEWTDWATHFDYVYREIKVAENKPGKDVATNYGVEFIWKRNGPDHYVHTLLFALLGLDKYGSAQATFIKRDDGNRFPIASRTNNTIPARRILGKKGYDLANL